MGSTTMVSVHLRVSDVKPEETDEVLLRTIKAAIEENLLGVEVVAILVGP